VGELELLNASKVLQFGGIPSGRSYQKHFAASANAQACSSNAASPNSFKDWKASA
jgi:hypothetical protein